MGLFDGLNEAPMGLQRLYFKPGRFLVKILKLKGITPAESFHGKGSFVVECEIYQTSDPLQAVGTQPAWVQTIGVSKRERETAFGAIKQFFAAVMGDPKLAGIDVETLADNATSDANPLAGLMLGLETTGKLVKATGKDFTVHNWYNSKDFLVAA